MCSEGKVEAIRLGGEPLEQFSKVKSNQESPYRSKRLSSRQSSDRMILAPPYLQFLTSAKQVPSKPVRHPYRLGSEPTSSSSSTNSFLTDVKALLHYMLPQATKRFLKEHTVFLWTKAPRYISRPQGKGNQ